MPGSTASSRSEPGEVNENGSVLQSTRVRNLSLRGKEARIGELTKIHKSLCKTADSVHGAVKHKLNNSPSEEALTGMLFDLDKHLLQLDSVYDELKKLHEPEAIPNTLRIDTDRVHSDRSHLLAEINGLLKPKPNSVVSDRRTNVTSRSASSRASSLSYKASEAKVRAMRARKQLEAQEEYDKVEREIEEKQRQLKLQKLRRLTEIEEEEAAELERLAREEEDSNAMAPRLFLASHHDNNAGKVPTDDQSPQRGLPKEPPAQMAPLQSHTLLAEALSFSRLPTPEPPVFTGDPWKYTDWETTFDMLIEKKTTSVASKVFYLKRYTAGDAKDAISGYLLLGTADAYKKARNCLKERYGNSFAISDSLQERLDNWPKITGKGREQLQKLTDFLMQCQAMIEVMPEMAFLNTEREQRKIMRKLPDWLVTKWSAVASDARHARGKYPDFETFTSFLARQARIVNEPMMLQSTPQASSGGNRSKLPKESNNRQTLSTNATAGKDKTPRACFFCKDPGHFLSDCVQLKSAPQEERQKYLKENKLCFSCLRKGHNAAQCTRKNVPTEVGQQASSANATPSGDTEASESHQSHSINSVAGGNFSSAQIVPVWVSLTGRAQAVQTYALLDSQSDVSFMSTTLQEQLQAPGQDRVLTLSTMTGQGERISTQEVKDLRVRGLSSDVSVDIPAAYTRASIPINRAHLPSPEKALAWPHLSHLAEELVQPAADCHVGLLLGYDCPQALAPREVVSGVANEPFAVRTDLGWSIVGKTDKASPTTAITHRVSVEDAEMTMISAMNRDFMEEPSLQRMSHDDFLFTKKIQENIRQEEGGHWTMPLPLKSRPGENESYQMAKKRMLSLQKKFDNDGSYHLMYKDFMDDIIARGEAELVPAEELDMTNAWYIPHFGVFHPKKPEKIRVVFDCAAKAGKNCLNDFLLQGPDMLNSLLGILIRFRERPVAIMADVERMFHQFRVDAADRNYLRFLWEGKVYRMTVHLFGACSSPSCSTFGLRAAAALATESEETARRYIERDFYVDDGLCSVISAEEGTQLALASIELCARSGIRLHKFLSNSRQVMEAIPQEYRAKEVRDIDVNVDPLPKERALGVSWCVETDQFFFKNHQEGKPLTRRGVLSTVSSVFDPLGFLSPFTLLGKQVMQETCRLKVDWDEPLDNRLGPLWKQWVTGLQKLHLVAIPRYVKENLQGKVAKEELHYFCDASNVGYGACCYLKVVTSDGETICRLILAKSKVAPLKQVTIPRLELQAAVLASQLKETVRAELRPDPGVTEYFWTDSRVVLGYITNETTKFSIYVANRAQVIRDRTCASSWHHVKTEENPADHASRGRLIEELVENNWFNGPDFLYDTNDYGEAARVEISESDPEVRGTCLTTQAEKASLAERATRFSTFSSAARAFATLIHRVMRQKDKDPTRKECLEKAETLLLKWSQEQYHRLDGLARLRDLNPFHDDKGLVRVGGRLQASTTMSYPEKHPVILPADHHITSLVIEHYHRLVGHGGKNTTINRLRKEGFWVVQCANSVMKVIKRCVICRKMRGRPATQQMSSLPQERVEPTPPFTHTGCDVFGPFEVKEGRKTLKRYGCLFTCLYSRAVHLEVLDDMSSDSFINAFRCLTALRGPTLKLFSDRGTNFKGAESECRKAFLELSDENQRRLAMLRCEFVYNIPASSHMGGVWERMIRTVRQVIQGLLQETQTRLDCTGLRTLFYEVTSIVNSRPLTVDHITDPQEPLPLTPNHLLTQKPAHPAIGESCEPDLYSRRRWKRVQYLADQFWKRWKRGYGQSLQPRRKWTEPQSNIEPGDVVFLEDPNPLRSRWQLGVIMSVNHGKDGLVRTGKVKKLGESGKPVVVERPIHKMKLLVRPASTQV